MPNASTLSLLEEEEEMGMASRSIGLKEIGEALKKAKSGWYSLHMAAASHAIAQRIPLVDFILEVRDARVTPPCTTIPHQLFDDMSDLICMYTFLFF